MRITLIVPLSPRSGASTLGANIAAEWAGQRPGAAFLDLSDTAVAWQGVPDGLTIVQPGKFRSLIEQGEVEKLQETLQTLSGVDRLLVSLPYSSNPTLWTFLTLDPDVVVLARLETAFARSMEEFMGMMKAVREDLGQGGQLTGLLLKLATKGPSTDQMLEHMKSAFDGTVVFSPIPHVKDLAETETTLLPARPDKPAVGILIKDISRRLGLLDRVQHPEPAFAPLAKLASRFGGQLAGWPSKAKELGLAITPPAQAGNSANEIIDELAAEIEQLQKELTEANKIQQVLQDQISDMEKEQKRSGAPAQDMEALANLHVEVSRLRNLLDSALSDSEALMREKASLREELDSIRKAAAEVAPPSVVEFEDVPQGASVGETKDLENEVERWKSEASRLAGEKDETLARIHELETEIARHTSREDQIQDLRAALDAQVEQRSTREAEVSQELEAVKATLQTALHAFEAQKAAAANPAELAALRAERDDLLRRLNETTNHLHGFKAERDQLEEKISHLSADLLTARQESVRIASTNPELDAVRAELDDARHQLSEAKNHVQGFMMERDMAQERFRKLADELQSVRSAPPPAANLAEDIPVEIDLDPEAEMEKERLGQALSARDREISDLKREAGDLRHRLEKAETARRIFARERTEMTERFEALRRETDELAGTEQQLHSGHDELVTTLKSDRERVRSELEVRTSLYQRLKLQLEPLREALKTGLAELPTLRNRAEQAEQRVNELERTCDELRQSVTDQAGPDEETRKEISRLKGEVDDARTRLEEAETRLAEQEKQLRAEFQGREEQLRANLGDVEAELDRSRKAAELAAIKAQNAEKALETKTREFHEDQAARQAETRFKLEALERDLDGARGELQRLEARAAEAQRLQDDLDQARVQAAAAKSLADEANGARLNLEGRVRELDRQLEEVRSADGAKGSRYEGLLRELADAREELQNLKQKAGRAAIAEKIAVERAARIVQLEAEVEELNRRIAGTPAN